MNPKKVKTVGNAIVIESTWHMQTTDNTTFDPQGGYTVSNVESYAVELSRDNDQARLRRVNAYDKYMYTDWMDIETVVIDDTVESVIDPDGFAIPLSLVTCL